jgi:S-disulfanyl-L-cysteine oxidoreductase SoxD
MSAALVVILATAMLAAQDDEPIVSIWDGVYTDAQADRGKATFDVNCSRCHNSDLTGSERGPALAGDRFLTNWLEGTLEPLFSLIRDTMPQGSANIVSDAGKIEVLAYVLRRNAFPPGPRELTTDRARLDLVQVLRKGVTPGLQNLSFVQVVGCLEPGSTDRWVLTRSSARPGTRERSVSAAELERARRRALGKETFTLVSAAPFEPATRRGHKVVAKGLLYRQPGDTRLNVTALETVASSCSE